MLHVSLLGRLRVADEFTERGLRLRPRAQRLLAYLLLYRRAPLTRQALAFTLWPDHPEADSLGALRRALSEVRAALPKTCDWVSADRDDVQWNTAAPLWLDLDEFERLVREGTPAALHAAVDLYSGDLLEGWDEEWVRAERARLSHLRAEALARLIAQHRALGEHGAALEVARRAMAADPLSESIHREVIALHYLAGDRAAALAEHATFCARLSAELGVEPMAETQALAQAIARGEPLPTVEPALRPFMAASAPSLPQLIGRDGEMAQLIEHWESSARGQGRLIVVSGEAGVGKSHLTRKLAEAVTRRGGLALIGECYEFERALAHQPLVEMLRAAAGDLRSAGLTPAHRAALTQLVPEVFGATSAPKAEAPAADMRALLFEAVLQAFLTLTRARPLLLLIEDVHWAAETVLDWLTYITPRLSGSRVLVISTYRTDEVGAEHALARLARRFAREGVVASLSLKPLSREAHRALLRQLSGLSQARLDPVADRLYAETNGHPFFLHEIVRGLMESGALTAHAGKWGGAFVEAAPGAVITLPDSLRATIVARAERLNALARALLRVAAVAGRVFDFALVQRAGGWADELALEALEALLARNWVRATERPPTFAFVHHLVREVIYRDTTAPRRAYWHRRLADSLEVLHPDDFESLAYHYTQADAHDRARCYHIGAGDRARQLVDLNDAAQHYHAALAHWPEADQAGRAEMLWRLGEIQWVLMEQGNALTAFEAARDVFDTLGERVKVGDLERLIGRMHWELDNAEAAWPHYWKALAILEAEPEGVELARAVSGISHMHMLASQYDEAITWGERALALAERLGAEDVRVHSLNNVGVARMLVHRYDPERGLAMMRESLRRSLDLSLPHDACRAYVNLADCLTGRSRYAEARAVYDELHTYATRVHARAFIPTAVLQRMHMDWLMGKWSAALAGRPQVAQFTLYVKGPWRVWAATRFGLMHSDLGQAERAQQILEVLRATAAKWGEVQTNVPYLGQLARAYSDLGRAAEAAAAIQQCLELLDANPTLHSDCTQAVLIACRWYAARPESLASARACLPRLERAHQQLVTPETAASLAEGCGLVALAEGRAAEAAEQFRRAATQWAASDRPYDHARALAGAGRALAADERAAAGQALDQADHVFDSLAAQLADDELRQSFLDSPLVREARAIRLTLN
jgi:DNA-binding SARP family transcriptional activator